MQIILNYSIFVPVIIRYFPANVPVSVLSLTWLSWVNGVSRNDQTFYAHVNCGPFSYNNKKQSFDGEKSNWNNSLSNEWTIGHHKTNYVNFKCISFNWTYWDHSYQVVRRLPIVKYLNSVESMNHSEYSCMNRNGNGKWKKKRYY